MEDESPPNSPRSEKNKVPLLFNLTVLSFIIITPTFVLSMLHLGRDAFFTVPGVFGFTIVYHTVVLILERQRTTSPSQIPFYSASSTSGAIIGASILLLGWMVAFALIVFAVVLETWKPANDRRMDYWAMLTQCILIPLEMVVMLIIIMRSLYERQYGRKTSWRVLPGE